MGYNPTWTLEQSCKNVTLTTMNTTDLGNFIINLYFFSIPW